jgi:AcrR family transcriptional regulator
VRPALTREYIVAVALALIDRDGLASLTMRKLGTELGVDPMAVYHHLPNKAALFDGVVEAVYAEIDLGGLPTTGSWRERMSGAMHRMRAVFRSHPNALPVLATRPANTPPVLAMLEQGLRVMQAAGFAPATALDALSCLSMFTVGHALAEVGTPVGGEIDDPGAAFATMDPAAYPHLLQAFMSYEYRPDDQYELGLQAMLDGLAQRLAAD